MNYIIKSNIRNISHFLLSFACGRVVNEYHRNKYPCACTCGLQKCNIVIFRILAWHWL